MLRRLEEICTEFCKKWDVDVLEFGGEEDHIHLLLDMHPNITPSKLVNSLKTVSSRRMRKEYAAHLSRFYWNPVLWTRAYCLISAGGAPIGVLREYIEKQEAPKT